MSIMKVAAITLVILWFIFTESISCYLTCHKAKGAQAALTRLEATKLTYDNKLCAVGWPTVTWNGDVARVKP